MNKRELLLIFGQALAANGILHLVSLTTDTEDDQINKAVGDAYAATQRLVATLQRKEGDLTNEAKL